MSGATILLAAGGTGGHLFVAQALAGALGKRGCRVELVTDARALAYGAEFPAAAVHAVPSATPFSGSPLAKALAGVTLARGFFAARTLLRAVKPAVVVGFGGYPTAPPLLAAAQLKIPTIIHEQNAVMGRANRFLSAGATLIATGFPEARVDPRIAAKLRHVGNPLRPMALAAAARPAPTIVDGRIALLVTGGSQGARVMGEVAPAAVALLPADARARLSVTQQSRREDQASVEAAYASCGVAHEVSPFFDDLPLRIAAAHLVVGRAGAGTVSELAAVGRAAILVPLPGSLDQDQAANAAVLVATGGADCVDQAAFTPQRLAAMLAEALADPAALTMRGAAVKTVGVLDAADRLAALVEGLALKG